MAPTEPLPNSLDEMLKSCSQTCTLEAALPSVEKMEKQRSRMQSRLERTRSLMRLGFTLLARMVLISRPRDFLALGSQNAGITGNSYLIYDMIMKYVGYCKADSLAGSWMSSTHPLHT
ncbi:hypothetical protein AAY473_012769 [Plecturocebus cupreus]